MKYLLWAALKAGVTAVLFLLLFRNVDLREFWATLRNAQFGLLAAAFFTLWIGHYLCIFRWRILMRPLMPVLSLAQLFRIYCIGLFFNLAFPTVVGGDVVKIYYAGKPSRKYAQSFAATFLDRDAGMLAMMIIACVALLAYPVRVPRVPVAAIVWISFFLFVFANVAVFMPLLHRLVTRALLGVRLTKIAAKTEKLSQAFQKIGKERRVLAGSLGISMINQFLVICVSWIIARGLGLSVSLVYFLVFMPVVTLISMIPVSLNGMGLREYAFLALFGAIGVSNESCIALGLLSSAAIILSAVPGGILYLFSKDQRDSRAMAALEADLS